MSAQRIKRVERQPFTVKDVAGEEHRFVVLYPILDLTSRDGPSEGRGLGEIQTASGHAVNKIGPGRYAFFDDPTAVFTSDDPSAP